VKLLLGKLELSLCKHVVIKVCSMEYLATQIELLLPTFFQPLNRSQNYGIVLLNVRAIVYPLKYLSQYNSLLFWPTLYTESFKNSNWHGKRGIRVQCTIKWSRFPEDAIL